MKRQAFKIYQEETKQRYVSHWDMDYLPREQLEAAREEEANRPISRDDHAPATSKRLGSWFRRLRLHFDDGCGFQR